MKVDFTYFGTPDVASETLEILKEGGFIPSLVVTSPDRPKGRKMILTPPPVKEWAIENQVPYIQPENIREADMLNDTKSDLFIVVAYGKILPEKIITAPRLGSINIHYSLLPKYRGASPVETAILNGETETGVTIQQMAYKMDSGAILVQETVKILPDETAPQLRKKLIKIGGDLLVKTLQKIMDRQLIPVIQQEELATYSKKITKEDGLIDLNGNPTENYNKFRAYSFWPRTFFLKNGKRIIITKAILRDGQFIVEKVIPEGGKEKNFDNI